MARPKKQTVDYFPHDTDASDSRTLTKKTVNWEFLLAKTHITDNGKAVNVLNTLASLGAIDEVKASERQ